MPGTRRIFAGVSGSPGSAHALRQAAQLAHHHDALLIPVLAWLPPAPLARAAPPDSGRWAPWRRACPPAPCATQRSPGRLA